jgi:predicted GNAT family acetyltransferase
MAGDSEVLGGVARVSWVYTPGPLRRRGYAAACVAALSQQVLDRGAEAVMLYTDLANPTSNAVYQRIGYRAVGDAVDLRFTG